jgi:type IV pilus assembly protein PilQ
MKIMKNRSMAVVAVLIAAGIISVSLLLAQEAAAPVVEAAVEPAPPAVAAEAVVAPAVVANVEAAPVVAAPEEAVAAAPVDEAEVDGETDFVLTSGSTNDNGLITVSLEDVELADVVSLFIRLSGANIICATTNLKGSVTANLQNVEWQPAFKAILERQNLSLQEDPRNKGIFIVQPRSPDEPEPWITETFPLSYLKSSEAADLLMSFLKAKSAGKESVKPKKEAGPKVVGEEIVIIKEDVEVVRGSDGNVVSYPAGNQIVVSTTEKIMEEIKIVLKKIDLPRHQVFIEAKIIEISGEDGKKIGIDWSMLDGFRMGSGQLRRDYKKTTTREKGSADYRVAEASRAYDDTGLKLSTADGADSDAGSAAALKPTAIAQASPQQYVGVDSVTPGAAILTGANDMAGRFTSVSDVQTAIFSADAVELVLSALQTSENAAFVSNPRVIVANEEKALIDMSLKQPYVITERTAGTQESPGDKFSSKLDIIPGKNDGLAYIEQAFFSSGLKLEVTPRINNASNITVIIEPTISTATPYTTSLSDGTLVDTGYPQIKMKRVRTTFSLGDGQTAVIGGLTTTGDTDVVKKIPLLGDIPLIGKYLFSHTTKKKTQIETIIFVTVGIIDTDDPRGALGFPESAALVQKRVDADGRLIKAFPAQDDPAQNGDVAVPNP